MKMSNYDNGGYLKFLEEDEIEKIHEASIRILSETGMIVENDELQKILQEKGAEVDRETNMVKFSSELLTEAIKTVPSSFTFYQRDGNCLEVGGKGLIPHTVGGPAFTYDLETGERRLALRKDVEEGARLVDGLDNFMMNVPLFSPSDVDPKLVEIEMVDALVRNTVKAWGNAAMSKDEIEYMKKVSTIFGGTEERPMCMAVTSPVTPLKINNDTAEAMMCAAKAGFPTFVLPCPTAGGTAPVTIAGALVQTFSETLGGIAMIQMIKPGNPVIYAPRISILDMRTGNNAWTGGEIGLISSCGVQLAKHFGIPVDFYGLISDSKVADEQLGYEKTLNAVLPALAGTDLISGGALMEAGKCASFAQAVIDNEIFGCIMKARKRFEINEETMAVDLIKEVVTTKGHYMDKTHTLKYARKGEQYFPPIADRSPSYGEWVSKGSKDLFETAREKAKEILAKHEVPPLDRDVEKELDKIIKETRQYYMEK